MNPASSPSATDPRSEPLPLRLTVTTLFVSAVIWGFLALFLPLIPLTPGAPLWTLVLGLGLLSVTAALLGVALRRRYPAAWWLSGLYLAALPAVYPLLALLTVLGLVGLLHRQTRAALGIGLRR